MQPTTGTSLRRKNGGGGVESKILTSSREPSDFVDYGIIGITMTNLRSTC
jgi:hypothetical protein